MRLKPLILTLLLVIWSAASWAAQVYQWTDANGVKHYSNQPPPDSVTVEAVKDEIAHDAEADRLKSERDAAVVQEIEDKEYRQRAEEAAETDEDAAARALEEKQVELDAVGEKVFNKRKYLRRRGRQDINAVNRLDKEIEALKADPTADPQKIESLEAERDAYKEKIYNTPRRARKGIDKDIEDYQEIEREVNALKEKVQTGENAPE